MSPERPAETSALVLRQVTVGSSAIPGETLIEDVSWTVAAGEFWVVGGVPGAGKSELLLTAAGLMPPERGEVLLFGNAMQHLPELDWAALRRRIGYVFPYGGRLFNRLTVAENLGLPICYHLNCRPGDNQERVQRVLQLTELDSWADYRPDRIPRNLHQRVGLARALVMFPDLLFLDNPLTGLDPRQIRWWINFLKRMMKEPSLLERETVTLIVSTDNFRLWQGEAQRFGLIHEKRWIDLGAGEPLSSASHPATRDLWLD